MTRFDVLDRYRVEEGTIRTAGQFCGQALYVPYFWDRYIAGYASEVGEDIIQFAVQDDDRIQFPELGDRQMIRLRSVGNMVEEA
jgi:hypothetical protein